MKYDYDEQQILLSFMISDPQSFAIARTIINPKHFDDRLQKTVDYILDYSDNYKVLPTSHQIKASTKVEVEKLDLEPQHSEWFLETIEDFSRTKALELAVLGGVDLIEKGRGEELEKIVKDAVTISLMRDLGTSYFDNPKERLENMKNNANYISTGWSMLDKKLYGGFTKGGLNVFAGGSGSGKSLFLQNLALNWHEMGFNVVYITLELSEDLVALRLDAMVAGTGTSNIFKNIDDVALKVSMHSKKSRGSLTIKKMPEAGTTANDIKAFLKEYEIKTGIKPDVLLVDYLDLMHPNNRAINPSDLFVKDKYTSEEMRALMTEFNLIGATASQLNRSSVEAIEFDHSHIAGGISKINTADNVFGIMVNNAMKERGEYQLQFLKTRSSSAVGQRMSLAYNNETMRIADFQTSSVDDFEKKASTDEIRDTAKNIANTATITHIDKSSNIRKNIDDLLKRNRASE